MKSIFKFLFLLVTAILLLAYFIGLSEKLQKPTFKNLPSSDYVWLGLVLLFFIFLNIKWLYLDRRNKNRLSKDSETKKTLGANIQTINQYDVFILAKDLNPMITKGMRGVILDIWGDDGFEIEFVKEDGTNYEFNAEATFTVSRSFIGEIVWRASTS